MRLSRILLFVLATAMLSSPNNTTAQIVQYKYTGTIPAGTSANSMVADGESFTAIFNIDTTVMDSDADPEEGNYAGAVTSGSLTFSGGHVSSVDFSGLDVRTADDLFGLDGVLVSPTQSTSVWLSALSEDVSTLSSDELPPVGTSFMSDVTNATGTLAFSYVDAFGSIDYTWGEGGDTSFMVTAVPEPTQATLVIGLLAMLGAKRRRK